MTFGEGAGSAICAIDEVTLASVMNNAIERIFCIWFPSEMSLGTNQPPTPQFHFCPEGVSNPFA